MKKTIDRRKKYYLGIDTETTNGIIDKDGKLDLSNALVYDVGWQIVDRKGNVFLKRSYVVSEIFSDTPLMKNAYFAEKIPMYLEDISKGKRTLAPFLKIYFQFLRDRKKYNCKAIFAHNIFFDYNALNVTLRYLTGSHRRFFFPYSVELLDTLRMSREVFGKTEAYTLFCEKHGYKTKHKTPRNRYTAEVVYRYLTGDINFIESHTGLEDVEIETKIFVRCLPKYKRKKKSP